MNDQAGAPTKVSRRGFMKAAGVVVATAGTGVLATNWAAAGRNGALTKQQIPASQGYLLVDQAKCSGCVSCMLACSLAHHGRENLSLARIQIQQDPFGHFPLDIVQEQCRQCVFPACVEVCPTAALHVDKEHGNVRTVEEEKCIGCERCVEACPYTPARAVWNFEDRHAEKCDLCAEAPFWEGGGPGGKQACVEICPMQAIQFTSDVPSQRGDSGYEVNLRGAPWKQLGYPTT